MNELNNVLSCESCQNVTFTNAFLLQKKSRFEKTIPGLPLVVTKNNEYYLIAAIVCNSCGHINNEFLPENLKAKK